jgi:hypothetical protein
LHLPRLAHAVAAHLPGDWDLVNPYDWIVFLVQGDVELGFRLIEGTAPARVRVTGALPEGHHHALRLATRSITASAVRGGAHIAKEVTRRLMPAYKEDIAAAKAAMARRFDRLDRYCGAIERVRGLVPEAAPWSSEFPDRTVAWGPDGFSFSYRVRSTDATCDVDLERLPEPVALEVIALIADRLDLASAAH